MVDRVLALPEGTRLYLLAPIVRGRKGEYRKELAELQKKGFQRVKVDGAFHEIADAPALDKKLKHDIEVVVDRIVVRADIATRLADSFQTALELADGIAVAEFADGRASREGAGAAKAQSGADPSPAIAPDQVRGWRFQGRDAKRRAPKKAATGESGAAGFAEAASVASPPPDGGGTGRGSTPPNPERIIFSEKFACPVSGFTIPEIEPRLFSFNNPYGACPVCDGLGSERAIDPDLVVPDETLSLRENAVLPWAKTSSPYYMQTLEALARHYKFSTDKPWAELPEKARQAILYGTGEEEVTFHYDDGLRSYKTTKTFEGVIPNLERRWKETESAWMREEIERYHSATPCEACHGYRLKPEALAVKIAGLHIARSRRCRSARRWPGSPTCRRR